MKETAKNLAIKSQVDTGVDLVNKNSDNKNILSN